jgi:N6-adenosine-specific RNA methylase IME4
MKKYGIIYPDFPWPYEWVCRQGACPYECMTLQDIYDLPMMSIAAPNCALLLWATYPKLREALRAIECWGFEYKTTAFTWIKTNPRKGNYFLGLGHYTRGNPEIVLLATRGHPKCISHKVPNLQIHARGRHSEKPAAIRDEIVRLFGGGPRIELFARKRVRGWDATGFDLDGVDIRDFLVGRRTGLTRKT